MVINWGHGRDIEILWEQFALTFHCNKSQIHQILLWKIMYTDKQKYKTRGENKE